MLEDSKVAGQKLPTEYHSDSKSETKLILTPSPDHLTSCIYSAYAARLFFTIVCFNPRQGLGLAHFRSQKSPPRI
jgi:hypothetical protein